MGSETNHSYPGGNEDNLTQVTQNQRGTESQSALKLQPSYRTWVLVLILGTYPQLITTSTLLSCDQVSVLLHAVPRTMKSEILLFLNAMKIARHQEAGQKMSL